jgi:tetratricopeptide (TPR) repeat protein
MAGQQAAIRAEALRLLHESASHVLLLASNEELAPMARAALDERSKTLWQQGKALWHASDDEAKRRLREDLLDIAVVRAHLVSAQGPSPQGEEAALAILHDAEDFFGDSGLVWHERAFLYGRLGNMALRERAEARSQALPAETASEHRALGRSLLYRDRFAEALKHFDESLRREPRDFWSNFLRGIATYRLGRYEEAALAFHGSALLVVATPEAARSWYNFGLAEARCGRPERALADYTEALRLDPRLAEAHLNRGILHLDRKDTAAAVTDFRAALADGLAPAVVHYHLAQAHLVRNEKSAAIDELRAALAADPSHAEASELLRRVEQK